jgi:hypothetical protein
MSPSSGGRNWVRAVTFVSGTVHARFLQEMAGSGFGCPLTARADL